ncbi:MAG: IS21 family transposase [Clostridiaceae bacterium]|nr:IS21 family transposase [Clostridiaceae bacterium]
MKESGTYIMLYEQVKIQGKSISEVARMTGMSRNTIRKYLRNGEQVHKAKGRKRQSKLDPYKTAIGELMETGIYNAHTIFERIREMGYDGGITILKDYIKPLRPPALKFETAVRRYETKPGKQAQMDWGILKYKDKKGRLCKIACFVMVLGYSRMRYVEFSRRCDAASLLRCMVNAFEYFNGIPDTVLTDRMKTVVISSDHGKPVWQEAFEKFAAEMGFVPKLCRVRRPQTKGKVERLVHFVRDSFMAGRRFVDFGDLQAQVIAWCNEVNHRIHGTTGERPVDLWKDEKLHTLPPASILNQYQWEERKVARDSFISFNGARYGVNWNYCGQSVRVRQRGDKVTIVSTDGEILYIHDVCHQSRKHVWAKGQYDGLEICEGKPYEAPYGLQVSIDDVEVRPLAVYENLAGVI